MLKAKFIEPFSKKVKKLQTSDCAFFCRAERDSPLTDRKWLIISDILSILIYC